MKKLFFIGIFFLSPIFGSHFSELNLSLEMWWCSGCGMGYPVSQKVCVNKDCPLFRQKKR